MISRLAGNRPGSAGKSSERLLFAGELGFRALARPDALDIAEHESTHCAHWIRARRKDGRTTAQQSPVLTAQDLAQGFHIPVDRFQVRISTAVKWLDEAIRAVKVTVESLRANFSHELRCLAQQVEPRGVFHLAPAVCGYRQCNSAEDDLGVESVAAFLEVTAVGNLGHHVGRAQEMA